jgi:PAS domain S-box-containing protein
VGVSGSDGARPSASEAQLRELLATIDQGYCLGEIVLDDRGDAVDYRFLEVNPQFEAMTGLVDAAGQTALELVPGLEQHWIEVYGRVALGGETLRFTNGSEALGRWFDVFAMPTEPRGRFMLVFNDVTAHKRAEDALKESQARFRNVADTAPVMIWVTEADGTCTYLNRRWEEFTGQDQAAGSGMGWLDAVHPVDRQRVRATFRAANRRAEPFEVEYRLRRQDGVYRWAVDSAAPRLTADGRFRGYVGSVMDISDRKEAEETLRASEQRFRAMSDDLPLMVWLHDTDGRQEFVNQTFCDFFGVTRDEMRGGRWQLLTHPDDGTGYAEHFMDCVRERRPFHHEVRVRRGDGEWRWLESWGEPRFGPTGEYLGHVGTSADVTDRKQLEELLRDRGEAERRARRRAELLAHCMAELESRSGVEQRARTLVELLVPRVADFAAVELRTDDETIVIAHPEPGRISTVELDALLDPLEPHSRLALPLNLAARGEGTLLVGLADRRRRPYDDDDHAFLRTLAASASLLLASAHLFEQERRIATRLQRSLLPERLEEHPELDLAARYVSAAHQLQVGGDWYDSFELADGRMGVVVGDVVGHGLEAAAAMGRLRSALHALAVRHTSPADVLSELDHFARGPAGPRFATGCFAAIEPSSAVVTYASAGHPPMLVVSPDGEVDWLDEGRSLPLCVAETDRSDASTVVAPGSVLLLYSDGLVERRRERLSTGTARLEATARRLRHLPVGHLCDRLVAELAPERGFDDDVVVLAARISPAAAPRLRHQFPARPGELAELRRCTRRWLEHRGVDARAGSDILLALGEACSNAVEHAYRDGAHGDITVEVRPERDELVAEVRDRGRWRPSGAHNANRGRGTAIMRAISRNFTSTTGPEGTTVILHLPLSRGAR